MAALSWLALATAGGFFALLAITLIVYAPLGFVAGVLGALVPFVIGRGIIRRSEDAGIVGTIVAFGWFVFMVVSRGFVTGDLVILWFAIVSAVATVEMRQAEAAA